MNSEFINLFNIRCALISDGLYLIFVLNDFSLDITDILNVTLRQLYNPERMKKNCKCFAVFSCREIQVLLFHRQT